MKYLKLIKYQNLLLIIFAQLFIRYFLFEPFEIDITLSNFGIFLLVLSTVCIAAGGNVINAIYRTESDAINYPKKVIVDKTISEKAAYNMFIILNVIGVLIGFYLSNIISKPEFSAIFIISSGLFYVYATFLKDYILIGNIVISLLVSTAILIVGLYDLFPAINPENEVQQEVIISIIVDYAAFIFLVNWIREMVRDQINVNGDHKLDMKTLPVVLGRNRSNKIIFAFGIIPIVAVVSYLYTYIVGNNLALIYALVFVLLPLLYFMVKIWIAKTRKDYVVLSGLLKLVMIFAFLSIGIFPLML